MSVFFLFETSFCFAINFKNSFKSRDYAEAVLKDTDENGNGDVVKHTTKEDYMAEWGLRSGTQLIPQFKP